MTSSPIRVATTALSGRIYAGRPTKDGMGFKEPRYDVTSDVLKAIKDKIGIGNQANVECDGVVLFRIAVLPAEPASVGRNAARGDNEDWLRPKDEHAVGSEADETPNPERAL